MVEKPTTLLYMAPLEGGALRKCPVDIFSERASLAGKGKERERTLFGWVLTKTMLMHTVEHEKGDGQSLKVLF